MNVVRATKTAAAWVLVFVNPSSGWVIRNDSEQTMPLWIAVSILLMGIPAFALLLVASVIWIIANVA
jgi:hypothetical protein